MEYTLTEEHKSMLSKDLDNCPFCGSDKVILTQNPMGRSAVFCRGCAVQTKSYETTGEAIEHWNTRV